MADSPPKMLGRPRLNVSSPLAPRQARQESRPAAPPTDVPAAPLSGQSSPARPPVKPACENSQNFSFHSHCHDYTVSYASVSEGLLTWRAKRRRASVQTFSARPFFRERGKQLIRFYLCQTVIIQAAWALLSRLAPCPRHLTLGPTRRRAGTALRSSGRRHLQLGDPGGELRHALPQSPSRACRPAFCADYFIRGGKSATAPSSSPPCHAPAPPRAGGTDGRRQLRRNLFGQEAMPARSAVNYLEKIQLSHAALTLRRHARRCGLHPHGRSIPRAIPGALDLLAQGQSASLPLMWKALSPVKNRPRPLTRKTSATVLARSSNVPSSSGSWPQPPWP